MAARLHHKTIHVPSVAANAAAANPAAAAANRNALLGYPPFRPVFNSFFHSELGTLIARSSSNNEGSFLWQQRSSFRKNASSATATFHGETPLATPPHLPPLQYFLLASWRFNLAFVFYSGLFLLSATATFHGETPLATPPYLPPLQYFLLASWRFNLAFVFYSVLGTFFTRSRVVAEKSPCQFRQLVTGKLPSAFRRHSRQLTGRNLRHILCNS